MSNSIRWSCVLVCLVMMSGCEIGRSWFQMSSDSPTPFMGFDLLPKRKTTQLTPPPGGHYPYATLHQSKIQPVAQKRTKKLRERIQDVQLPHVSTLLKRDKEELIAFPEPIGVEGIPEE